MARSTATRFVMFPKTARPPTGIDAVGDQNYIPGNGGIHGILNRYGGSVPTRIRRHDIRGIDIYEADRG
jgi:hypothetical protein